MGADPAPSLSKLRSLIGSGQLHYVLLIGSSADAAGGGAGPTGVGGPRNGADSAATTARDEWVRDHGTVVHIAGLGSGVALYRFA
jgi:hypothetical protein